ncbi:hypothetical protein B0H14DRAFT_2590801 [Mycena olivaceomarginata]|nr:hypothetical protein B0H14DRAFT_2590801 [Mycena olivaceomarginata]
MSNEDFALNNEDPTNVSAGRGLRNRQTTASSSQYHAYREQLAASLTRRRARAEAVTSILLSTTQTTGGPYMSPMQAQEAPYPTQVPADTHRQSSMPVESPLYPQNYNNPAYATNIHQNNILNNSPNPFHPEASHQFPYHNYPAFNTFYTMQGFGGYPDYDFNDNDEEFGTHWSLDNPSQLPSLGSTATIPVASSSITGTPEDVNTSSVPPTSATATPQNLRVFPQADASPWFLENARLAPWPTPVIPAAASSPIEGVVARRRLVRRTNIFGPGLHDNRQCPFTPSSTPFSTPSRPQEKENEVMDVPSDDSATGSVRKKSRKMPGARSIRSIQNEDLVCGQAMEIGYAHIRYKVMTNEKMTWIEGREAVAELAQEGLDYGFSKLGLDPVDFAPVTEKEQDLVSIYSILNPSDSLPFQMRERVWGTRKAAKYAAREIVKGPNGYGLIQCGYDDKPEVIESTGAANRAIVATLVLKSGLVYLDPFDCTLRGSMYKHPAIQAMAEATVFKNVLADGVQHPDWFDDGPGDARRRSHPATAQAPIFGRAAKFIHLCAARRYHQFVADLKTFRESQEYSSNPTVLTGNGPARTLPPSFLARTLQESITEKARLKLFKNIVAPVPSTEVMDTSDFALNQ